MEEVCPTVQMRGGRAEARANRRGEKL